MCGREQFTLRHVEQINLATNQNTETTSSNPINTLETLPAVQTTAVVSCQYKPKCHTSARKTQISQTP